MSSVRTFRIAPVFMVAIVMISLTVASDLATAQESNIRIKRKQSTEPPVLILNSTDRASVTKMALLRDGSLLAIGKDSGEFTIWDRRTRKKVFERKFPSSVDAIAYSDFSDSVAVSGKFQNIEIFDLKLREWKVPIEHYQSIGSLAFSSAGVLYAASNTPHRTGWNSIQRVDKSKGVMEEIATWDTTSDLDTTVDIAYDKASDKFLACTVMGQFFVWRSGEKPEIIARTNSRRITSCDISNGTVAYGDDDGKLLRFRLADPLNHKSLVVASDSYIASIQINDREKNISLFTGNGRFGKLYYDSVNFLDIGKSNTSVRHHESALFLDKSLFISTTPPAEISDSGVENPFGSRRSRNFIDESEGHLVFTSSNNYALAFNIHSGAFSTTISHPEYRFYGSLRAWDKLILIGANDANTNSFIGSYGIDGVLIHSAFYKNTSITATAACEDGGLTIGTGNGEVIKLNDQLYEVSRKKSHSTVVQHIACIPHSKAIISAEQSGQVALHTPDSADVIRFQPNSGDIITSLAVNAAGDEFLTAGRNGKLNVFSTRDLRLLVSFNVGARFIHAATFDRETNEIMFADGHYQRGNIGYGTDASWKTWNRRSGSVSTSRMGHTDWITQVVPIPRSDLVVTASNDGYIKFWSRRSDKELGTLSIFTDGTWVVTDPEGRFDTADLESMPHLHWVMPDDPFTPVPLEAFMKDYYEPRLLARILAGETFKPVRALTSLNRTQPEVKIVSIVPEGSDPSLVSVTVSAAGATKSYLQGEGASSKEVPRPTAVHDLRLFRDGQVVGYADGKLAEFSTSGSGSAFTKTFTVRLPRAKAGQDVVFSAYAFNDDRVKSETVRSIYKAPALSSAMAATSSSTKGRAYVISMGVNQHENSAWNLGYAANDARAVAQRVSADLRKSAQYAEVVPLVLAADGSTQQASKAALRAVLARLAGQVASPADQAALQGVAGAEQLRKAQPDDLLLISFAGHGFADDAGQFYLVPQDTGPGSGKQITAALKAKSISSEELSLWLRDVDAGDMTMIVDACQSAASVQAEGFKPGPMGSRGLGQLSFDKGMRILAASQSDEFALEDQRLKHGLLTFSLINDGLEAFNADFEPQDKKIWLDEWLKYGVKRVPTLADEVKGGTVKVANRGPERGAVRIDASGAAAKAKPAQQPALFDFAKNRRPVVLGAQ